MDVTEDQHIDAVRAHLIQRYQFLETDRVDNSIGTAHHRFDGCQSRDFVPLLVKRAATHALDTPRSGGRREPRRRPEPTPRMGQSNTETGRPG
ncbi:three-helix bundle dimerization domain-containing protein [Rhodococcus wratislaviensis]|uniref:three-helix bundle dimerization domain-containing protein n=1 Tax=Rhodococcus wratislaviensis TaxID=44752 RepID=UPI00365CFC35